MSEHMLRPGGLMRCCTEVELGARVQSGEPPTEGEVLTCRHCSGRIKYRDGAWEWVR